MTTQCPKCKAENPDESKFCNECGLQLDSIDQMPAPPTQTLETSKEKLTTGSTFAERYQIIEELGRGGMGKVYKALDNEIKEKIALKLIKPEISSDKKTIDRFQNELKLARKISHRNVCRMHDLGKSEGNYFITMEYVDGEDLKGMIRMMGHLSAGKAIAITKQVCEGLSEAHRIGVVHRDLKPSNIMIDKDGNTKIMDFGIARSLSGKGITGVGVMIGTPEYMSPEQVESKEVDQRSDIYSLGVILYEIVTGQVPFDGDTPYSIGVKHKSEMPRNPKEINPQIPDELNRMILKCLEKDKEKRFQSAGELHSELENIEKGIPTTERAIPEKKPLTSREITVTFGMKKLIIPVIAIAALIIAVMIIWKLFPRGETLPLSSSGKPSIAIMYFENRSDEPELEKILVDMLTTNLSRYEGIEVVSSQRLFDILKQLGKENVESINKSVATEVASQAGVETMMTGSVIKIGNKIRITSQLTNVNTGAIIGSEQVECNKVEEIFEMADLLTEKVSIELGVSQEKRGETLKITDVTTNSLEAYKYYREGLENVWTWKFQEAKKSFEQAIEIDPGFAMAHFVCARIDSAYVYWAPFVDLSSARKSIQLAKQNATKATDIERAYIDLFEAHINGQNEKAHRLAVDLVKKYPNEKEAYGSLERLSWALGKYDQSIEAGEKVLELDPTYANAYNDLAYDYSRTHNHEKAISTIKKYIALQPDNLNPYDSAWEIYMRAGLYNEAIQICEDALKINLDWRRFYLLEVQSLWLKGDRERALHKIERYGDDFPNDQDGKHYLLGLFFLCEGKYEKALTELKKVIEIIQTKNNVDSEMWDHFDMGKLLTEMGQYSRALGEFKKAEELSTNVYDESFNPIPILSNYLVGIAMVKKRDYRAAQAYASRIEKFIHNKDYDILNMDYYHLLNAEIHVAQGNGQAAMDSLAKVSYRAEEYSPRYMILEPASLALMGEAKKAISLYLLSPKEVDRRAYNMGDIFYYFLESSKADYYVAKVYEGQGNAQKAIEHYEKFLDLWKNADPGIAEVVDARKNLAGLKSRN
jgi:serine/threonine protein kinase/tetratricopeptide (TPR) repeat protein